MLWTCAVVLFPDVIAIFCACASIKARFRLTAAIQASAIFLKTNTNSNKIKIKISLNRIRSCWLVVLFLSFKKWVLQRKKFSKKLFITYKANISKRLIPPWIMINGLPVNFDLIIYIFQLWKSLRNFIKKPLYKKKNLPSRRFAVHDTKEFLVFSLASRWLHQCPCPEAHIFFQWIETQCSRSV